MARKHLIIGCGPAALSALEKIRSIAREDQVKLVAMEDCPPYWPSSLPHLLSGRLGEEALWMRPQGYFQDVGATLATGKEVVQVLPASKEVVYRDGQREGYDTLLIATGSEPLRPAIRGLAETGCLGFRTLQDCRALAARLGAKSRVAVLGGGLVGMEVAMALQEKGHQVEIVERESRLLPLYFDMLAGGLMGEIFREVGAQLHTGQEAIEVHTHNGRLEVTLSGGASLEADLLVTAVGVRARTSFLAGSGVKVYQGVVVDQHMRSSVPDIYAAGDAAEAPGFFGGRGVNATLPSAVVQGKVAGAAMAGQPEPYEGWIPMNVFNFFGHEAFSVGLAIPPGDDFQVATVSDIKARSYGKLVLRKGRLVGAVFLDGSADPGVFAYLVRHGVELAPHLEALLEKPGEVGRCLMLAAEKSEAALTQ